MPFGISEVRTRLESITVPAFVKSIRASAGSFAAQEDVKRDYCLLIDIGEQRNPYKNSDPYKNSVRHHNLSNSPFFYPSTDDELRAQVATAVLMAVSHETLEQVSDGGKHLCDPHQYKGGSPLDTWQWLMLLDSHHTTVQRYCEAMAVLYGKIAA